MPDSLLLNPSRLYFVLAVIVRSQTQAMKFVFVFVLFYNIK
jgi:hypothetical protein